MLNTNRERLAVGLVAASMLGYVGVSYVQRKRRSAARVVPPQHGAVLHLVNMSSTEAAALSSVFSSWSSSFKPILTQTMAYELDQTTLLSTVQMEAMTAFTEVGSSGPCVTMRIGATFGHEKDAIEEDATWPTPINDLKRFASTYAGAPLTLTVYLAYADRPQYCEVFQHKVTGVTCSLPQIDNTFTSLEDLLVLNTPLPELFPRLAHLFPIEKDLAMGALRGNRIALEYASLHLSKTSELARGMEGGTLLLRPHRWRAYTDLAYAIMYRWQESALQSTKPWTLGQCLTSTGKTFAASLGLTEAQRREYTRHLLQFDPKDPLCGRFENHITVNFEGSEDAEAECQRFIDTAAAIGVKIVSIALPKGSTFPAQVMTSYYTSGRVKECTLALLEMGMFLTLRGFKCARVKMELQLSEDLSSSFFMKPHDRMDVDPRLIGLCPVQDEPAADARNMSEVQYFEFHVKLGIPEVRVTEATPLVKAVGQEHNAHLSKNAFKVYSGEPNSASDASERLLLYFLTLRVYRTGFATCVQRMHALRAAAEAALAPVGGRVTTVQREYSVFDSNTGLDAGWFDRSAATPSFMLAE